MKIISLNVGPFCFSFSIIPLMAALFFAAIFAGLGRWQVDRMFEKQAIEEQYRERGDEAVRALPERVDDIEAWRFRKVRINGTPFSGKQFLLDNQVRNKQAGYNVLTPMTLDDGRVILVDRGWVPLVGGTREQLPQIDISPETQYTIEGRFYAPFGDPVSLGDPQIKASRWPIVIPYMDFALMKNLLRTSVEPFAIRMSPSQSQPKGYLREWPSIAFSSTKHLGYAVQWFALSLTVLILLIALNTKRR